MSDRAEVTPTDGTVVVTFVTWDADTDGVAVEHDGVTVWQERSFDSIDQYLKTVAPLGQPVVLEWRVDE